MNYRENSLTIFERYYKYIGIPTLPSHICSKRMFPNHIGTQILLQEHKLDLRSTDASNWRIPIKPPRYRKKPCPICNHWVRCDCSNNNNIQPSPTLPLQEQGSADNQISRETAFYSLKVQEASQPYTDYGSFESLGERMDNEYI